MYCMFVILLALKHEIYSESPLCVCVYFCLSWQCTIRSS